MRLSISSSNDRIPQGPWLRSLIAALGAVLLSLGAWEGYWRSNGFRPSVGNTEASWIAARLRVGPDSTVLLGTSRIMAGLHPEVWQSEMAGEPPVQLALLGTSPVPILTDLADREWFAGLAVVDLPPRMMFDRRHDANAAFLVQEYQRALRSPSRLSEAVLRVFVASRLAFRNGALTPARLKEGFLSGRPPEVPFFVARSDRYRPLDFTRVDPQERMQIFHGRLSRGQAPLPVEAEIESILRRVESATARILARGGRVVFVHFPICGLIREIDESRYPRHLYWDRFAASTSAVALHAEDYPELARFPCRDGEHLDQRDARGFTKALAGIVRSKSGGRPVPREPDRGDPAGPA